MRRAGSIGLRKTPRPMAGAISRMGMQHRGSLVGLPGAALSIGFLDFSETLDSRITFTRSGTSTRVNSSGLIESVAANTARFDYDPTTLAPLGMWAEEARTNLCLQSEDFSSASWKQVNGLTVSADAAVSPDGTTNADKLQRESTATAFRITQNFSATSGTTYTVSAYLKAGEVTWARIGFDSVGAFGVNGLAYFDIGNGVAGQVGSGLSGSGIKDAGGGYYKIWVTMAASSTATGTVAIWLAEADGDATFPSGNSTDGLYVWGAQLEAAANASSYIRTTTASVTRAGDVPLISDISGFWSATEGTIVVKGVPLVQLSSASRMLVYISDGATSGERITLALRSASNDDVSFVVADGGVSQAAIEGGSISLVSNTLAAAYKANDFAFYSNGALVGTDTSGTLPTVSQMQIGGDLYTTTGQFNGHIQFLEYFSHRVPNHLLTELSK